MAHATRSAVEYQELVSQCRRAVECLGYSWRSVTVPAAAVARDSNSISRRAGALSLLFATAKSLSTEPEH